jgi:hypothetical protein
MNNLQYGTPAIVQNYLDACNAKDVDALVD